VTGLTALSHLAGAWADGIQDIKVPGTAWTAGFPHPHHSRVRVLTHIKRLDDCFGQFLARVSCPCGASRHIEPEVLAPCGLVNDARGSGAAAALLAVR
jgi:hypothetical protein